MANPPKPITYRNIKWYDFVNPTQETVQFLAKKFHFHPLDLEDCLTENQRPKIDEYETYIFIVLHFPVFNPQTKRVRTAEVDIFVGPNFVVTLHDGTLLPIDKLRESCKKINHRREHFGKGTGFFLYEIISELFDYCFPILDSMGQAAAQLERDVFDAEIQRDLLKDLLLMKKNIITFRRIISPERPVISGLEHKNKKFLPEHLEVYFDDVVDKIEKIWSSLDSLKEVAESLQEANESLISHRTGDTIKVLTVFSVIMLPLTLISGVYGMNIDLPFMEHPKAFFLVLLAMLAVAISMLIFFRYKKWL
jgi:magnesium transporter